jgi:glycosyltransferase involved in cell wall biosynthesis
MLTPRVSVLIPCFNAAPFLAAALDSVLAQTYRAIEIIVVDDGSTDGSAEVLRCYQAQGIKVVSQSNRGQSAAANAAYAQSTGNLIKFFDADDILEPDMIERQVARLGGRTDAVALGEWRRFYTSVPDDAPFPPLRMYRDARPLDWLVQEWNDARPMMQCGLWLIPRPIIDAVGLWDEWLSLINDLEFFTRVLLGSNEIMFAPGARLHYRSAVLGSLSGQKSRQAVESAFLSIDLATRHLLDAEDSQRTRRACANLLQNFDYTFFPDHSDLRSEARARVMALDGSDLEPDGPPGFHRLRPVIGWRAARYVQRLAESRGLNRAARMSRGRRGAE